MRRKKKLLPAYIGPKSNDFWSRVNALNPECRSELYACGVLLQNMERTILTWLKIAESEGR